MFSVIIPTMWRYNPFYEYLEDLLHEPLIGEVILINNDVQAGPQCGTNGDRFDPIWRHKNLVHLPQIRNIYVNPAWNLGVQTAKHRRICIMNDDIIIDSRVFRRLDQLLNFTPNNVGVVGLAPGDHPTITNQPPVETGIINLRPRNGEHLWGFGTFFAMYRDYWIPIPDELKMYYGDNFVVDYNELQGRTNYIITDCMSKTPMSVTSKDFQNEFEKKEQVLYPHIYKDLQLRFSKS